MTEEPNSMIKTSKKEILTLSKIIKMYLQPQIQIIFPHH